MTARRPRTTLVHGGSRRSQYGEVSEAIFLTQGFVYGSAAEAEARFLDAGPDEFIYARYGNPTVRMFEERMALLEGCEDAFATASGMAAVSGALLSALSAGDRVVAARALFGSCLYVLETLLRRYGVEVELVDGTDPAAWERALAIPAKVVFLESISNPTLEVVDIRAVARLARAAGALLMVDNVFATPVLQRTFELGADVVIYSATKHVDGQGRALGGIVLGSHEFVRGTLEPHMKHTGGSMSPFNAWVMLKGLETLDLRVRAQSVTAARLACAAHDHPQVVRALYPHHPSHPQHNLAMAQMEAGGTVLSLDLGSRERAFAAIDVLRIPVISNNLGDAKSIVTHPATTTHQRLTPQHRATLGIGEGLIRFSAGLEDPDDLVDDLTAALDAA